MRKAVVVGFDYHVSMLCRKMNAHATSWRFLPCPSTREGLLRATLSLATADALVSFGGIPGPHPLLLSAARARKVPIFIIWAGTDVTRLLERPHELSHARRTELKHLAVAPWLAQELKQVGIDAQYLPIIGVRPSPTEMPKTQFSVLTYLPEPRRDFYGRLHVYDVARKLPHVDFSILGAGGPDPSAPANVHYYGWQLDVAHFIDRSCALLRVADHDGMSLIVLEALARGRYVAWKYKAPGVRQVVTPEDSCQFICELYALHAAGQLDSNQVGIDYIAAAYEERQVSLALERFFDTTVEVATQQRNSRCRVVISGLDVFAADVADLNNRSCTGWNARVLQFETRYEIAESLCGMAMSDVWYTIGTPRINSPSIKWVAGITGVPRVLHWVGTDIEMARHDPVLLKKLRHPSITHLTEAQWEADELGALGIQAEIVPLPPRFSLLNSVPPLPETFTVLAYLPRFKANFYGSEELETIVRAFRGRPIQFVIVGGGKIEAPPDATVENLGWCFSLDEVYARASALLRFTLRDGLSLMVLEALAFGRHVLWTKSFPFVRQTLTLDQICDTLDELLRTHEAGELKPQADAAEFIRTTYDREKCIRKIATVWEAAARNGRHRYVPFSRYH